LSPQHLDKTWRETGIGSFQESTDSKCTKITWEDELGTIHTKTISHTSKSGIPVCYTAPNYTRNRKFIRNNTECLDDERVLIACLGEHEILPPEGVPMVDTEGNVIDQVDDHLIDTRAENVDQDKAKKSPREKPITLEMDDVTGHVAPMQDEFRDLDPKTVKLLWHYRLGHAPFSTINRMAERGDLPKRICKAADPMCALCQYGQATRRPWQTKAAPKNIEGNSKVTGPGDCISVDQMQSPVPGLIAQNKGSPTRERYMAATIFVDHYSDVTFVHLQKTLNAKDTIEAKEAFERWANSHSVKVKHYHTDNGRFAETDFMAHVAKSGQTISFCGVNPHFQNGRAERRIRALQDLGRTQLLHAIARWPVAISHHPWPYAVANVGKCLNDTARPGEEKTRIERFTGSDVRPNVKDQHHLGCPAYVLDSDMQSGKKIPKWMPRARVGIYLGKSPRHARNV
jgi:hypothetical protein